MFLLEDSLESTILSGLAANSPVAAGLILAMWLFLRYLERRDTSLGEILKSNTEALENNSKALSVITTAVQYCQYRQERQPAIGD